MLAPDPRKGPNENLMDGGSEALFRTVIVMYAGTYFSTPEGAESVVGSWGEGGDRQWS